MLTNVDLQQNHLNVKNSVVLQEYDPETSTYAPVTVTYDADYLLNVYRYSSSVDILEVKADYTDGGKDEEQFGVFAKDTAASSTPSTSWSICPRTRA